MPCGMLQGEDGGNEYLNMRRRWIDASMICASVNGEYAYQTSGVLSVD